jgi:hypothetical protein
VKPAVKRTFSTSASTSVMKPKSSHCTATNHTHSGSATPALLAAKEAE